MSEAGHVAPDTPKSDRAYRLTLTKGPEAGDWVRLEFARELERELADTMADMLRNLDEKVDYFLECAALKSELRALKETLNATDK